MKISELSQATTINGSEEMMIVQNGVSKRISLAELAAAQPDANGIYPDVPLNRVSIHKLGSQQSTIVAVNDNLQMIDRLLALCFPCQTDSNSNIVTYLNGSDVTKTADGLTATLDDPLLQCMVRIGGFYHKYEYVASTNTKVSKFSVYPVKGYKYVRRRFIGMYSGYVESNKLYSRSGVWSTQSVSTQKFHEYAKNLGDGYREIAHQDYDVYRWMWWLVKQTYNSQSIYRGVVDVTGWDKLADDGGKTSYGRAYINGYLNDVAGHEGQKAVDLKNGQTLYPNKFLWCEGLLSGPIWIWCTGRIKYQGKWYEFKDLSKIAFTVNDDATYLCDECSSNGYILETFEDTGVATAIGGSNSKGLCDCYWTNTVDSNVYVPAVVGDSHNAYGCGLSVLTTVYSTKTSHAVCGGCLASDDPTDRTPDGTTVG